MESWYFKISEFKNSYPLRAQSRLSSLSHFFDLTALLNVVNISLIYFDIKNIVVMFHIFNKSITIKICIFLNKFINTILSVDPYYIKNSRTNIIWTHNDIPLSIDYIALFIYYTVKLKQYSSNGIILIFIFFSEPSLWFYLR